MVRCWIKGDGCNSIACWHCLQLVCICCRKCGLRLLHYLLRFNMCDSPTRLGGFVPTLMQGICSALKAEMWGADCPYPRTPTIVFHVSELIRREWCVQVCHIPRDHNRLAHSLAKLSNGSTLSPIYFPQPPALVAFSEYVSDVG
ncbi:hypothetical protein V6N11_069853 [Hibiscus sabdariffa]|uniref:RNase H type-1 domain-containing protein n=1 Tax=Hibiscus sabdariffa TaxID=183260 RepID=A0ABR2Q415_9ROSI